MVTVHSWGMQEKWDTWIHILQNTFKVSNLVLVLVLLFQIFNVLKFTLKYTLFNLVVSVMKLLLGDITAFARLPSRMWGPDLSLALSIIPCQGILLNIKRT